MDKFVVPMPRFGHDMNPKRTKKEVEVIEVDTSSEEEESQDMNSPQASTSKKLPLKSTTSRKVLRSPVFRFNQKQTTKLKALFKKSDKISSESAGSLAIEFNCKQQQIRDWFLKAKTRGTPGKLKATGSRRGRGADFAIWQKQILQKFYKSNRYPSKLEYASLEKKAGFTHEQVKKWFSRRRHEDRVEAKHKELKAVIAQTPSPNTTPMFFYEEAGTIAWRGFKPDENSGNYEYIYTTQWSNAASSKSGSSIGLSNCVWPTEAAERNNSNVTTAVNKIKNGEVVKEDNLACSYRLDVIMDDLVCDPTTAVSTGIFCATRNIAADVKWFFRLRFLGMGTFHPTECLESLKLAVPELEKVAQLMIPHLAPRNQRWMTFSDDAFKRYIANGCNKVDHPGLDKELVGRFEVKEKFGFDAGKISPEVLKIIMAELQAKTEQA